MLPHEVLHCQQEVEIDQVFFVFLLHVHVVIYQRWYVYLLKTEVACIPTCIILGRPWQKMEKICMDYIRINKTFNLCIGCKVAKSPRSKKNK